MVRFLTRAGCHLCEQARPLLTSAALAVGVTVEEVDIDTSPDLTRDYGLRIPVVLGPDDQVIAEGRIEPRRLRRELRRLRSTVNGQR
ncbi:MAG: glutaredoxin family protein [Acidimicrobiia bacterium]